MQNVKHKLGKNAGFTLVEMLIVVAIIAVLIAVSIPLVSNSLETARDNTDLANERAAKAEANMVFMGMAKVYDHTTENEVAYNPGDETVLYYDATSGKLLNMGDKIKPYGKCTVDHGDDRYADGKGGPHNTDVTGVIRVKISIDGNINLFWDNDTMANMGSAYDTWAAGIVAELNTALGKNNYITVQEVQAAVSRHWPDAVDQISRKTLSPNLAELITHMTTNSTTAGTGADWIIRYSTSTNASVKRLVKWWTLIGTTQRNYFKAMTASEMNSLYSSFSAAVTNHDDWSNAANMTSQDDFNYWLSYLGTFNQNAYNIISKYSNVNIATFLKSGYTQAIRSQLS